MSVNSTLLPKRLYLSGNYNIFDFNSEFDYSIQQNIQAITSDIYSLDTNTNITLFAAGSSATSATYVLKENENIQLYAPNLIDIQQYSNYVKYEFYSSDADKVLAKDADIVLGANEWIIFYWKNSDDEDAEYQYYKYISGDIVKSSFNCYTTSTSYGSSLTAGPGVVIDTTLAQHVADDILTILSGNRHITNRKVNTVTINDDYSYCYWIRNSYTTINGVKKYELFSDTSDEYMLQSGEYFIYTNKSFTELNIIGSGTKIIRNRLSSQEKTYWYVPVIEYSDIVTSGINAFKDSDWYIYRGVDYSITLTEMQFINLGYGCSIKCERTDTTKTLAFNNAGTNGANLSDFIIKYTQEGDSSIYPLPAVYSSSISWTGKSILDLDLSKKTAQILYSNQSITWYDASHTSHTLSGSGTTLATATYLISNIDLFTTGGIGLNTIFTDTDNNTKYLKLMSYKLSTVSSASNIIFYKSGKTLVKYTADGTYTVTMDLSSIQNILESTGNYQLLLKVIQPNSGQTVEFTYTNSSNVEVENTTIFGNTITDAGVYFISIPLSVTDALKKLSITISGKTDSDTNEITLESLKLGKVKNYYYNSSLTPTWHPADATTEEMLKYYSGYCNNSVYQWVSTELSSQLDGKFNVFFEEENNYIDPYNPLEYFKDNNPLSKFTLAKLDNVNINIINR